MSKLFVGAASKDITPATPQFLFGYPHVERYSEGVNDPILSTAMYLRSDSGEALFLANDIIFVDGAITAEVRQRLSQAVGIPQESVLVSATHTHSAPIVVEHASNRNDPVVPEPDPTYRAFLTDSMTQAGIEAVRGAVPATMSFAVARADGIGTNRRNPAGPQDPEVPVLVGRAPGGRPIACMLVYSMHPTVLHEDSKLISGDFPAYARQYLQQSVLGSHVPVLFHNGTSANQSPRYVARANTIQEAERLGTRLGVAVESAIRDSANCSRLTVVTKSSHIDLPRRKFPDVRTAQQKVDEARAQLETLRRNKASRELVRTAETDWFGASEVLAISQAEAAGDLEYFYNRCLPAEVQVIMVGPFTFVGFPGELSVEYGLELKRRVPGSYPICLANGELQGYIVTENAAEEGGYEACNALFDWSSGPKLVDRAVQMVNALGDGPLG